MRFEPSEFYVPAHVKVYIYVTPHYGGGFVAKCPSLVPFEERGDTKEEAVNNLAKRIEGTHDEVRFDIAEAEREGKP